MSLRPLILLFCIEHAWSQTQIDLQAQSRNVDFSSAATTRPLKSGTALPATCTAGEMFFLTNAAQGSNLYGCATANNWSLEGGGSGGTPVQSASQLGDLAVILNAPSTLVIGPGCVPVRPCNARLGSLTFSFTASASAAISSGTGTAFIYLDSTGRLTVGHNMTVTCASGCQAVSGVTGFPSDSLPLFTWTAANGTWDSAGGTDVRAFQSTTNVAAGLGMLAAIANGRTTLSIDPTLIGVWSPPPAISSAACSAGAWSMDANFYYLCIAANTWRRVALSTW